MSAAPSARPASTLATGTHRAPLPSPAELELPPLDQAQVAGAYARAALDTARELGVELGALGRDCGLPGLPELPERIAVTQYMGLLDAAARRLDSPLFGLQVGRRMRLATFASYGLVLCTCRDLRHAAEQTRRFEGLAHELGRSELVAPAGAGGAAGMAAYRWHSPWLALPGGRELAESVMVGIHTFVSWLSGSTPALLELDFVHAAPPGLDLAALEREFGARLRFGAPVTEARFAAALLDAPLAHTDHSLFPELARAAEQRLAERRREAAARAEPAIAAAVREGIEAQLMHDRARLPEVAQALGLSPRSLQRRLGEAGLSFSALLDQTRRGMAQRYLLDPALSLTEIAFLLGFGEQSSFNHAFRAWFGTTPAAWREGRGKA